MADIYVCQSGSCRNKGGEAVLVEIEELANALGKDCNVQASGCLGMCRRAPAAIAVTARGKETNHTQIKSLEDSGNVVFSATGRRPPLQDPVVQERLSGVRAQRLYKHACSIYRWNTALQALSDQIETIRTKSNNNTQKLISSTRDLVENYRQVASKAGYKNIIGASEMPSTIEKYVKWSLERVEPVTKHSAIFHFECKDRKRGTPHPRGRGRRPQPNTWHTTLLAGVGENDEGPLPWIERDYTPISSATEWEKGKCSILIKIYMDGAATSWLYRLMKEPPPPNDDQQKLYVWLSQPVPTLRVPYLDESPSFYPKGVLLLLAGTGVVALPQILHHREPVANLGIGTHTRDRLKVPIDLVLSCREDDILMLRQITQWCKEGCDAQKAAPLAAVTKGLRSCTLLLSSASPHQTLPPFANDVAITTTTSSDEAEQLKILRCLPNSQILFGRLSLELLSEALAKMPIMTRVVISGPTGYNSAAKKMLTKLDLGSEAITILNA